MIYTAMLVIDFGVGVVVERAGVVVVGERLPPKEGVPFHQR